MINHTIPDDDKAYHHRAGRTGRAGKTGIAVTFVDWDDLHKWALINRALEFGQPEPVETYSSSPHLFTDLDIPAGTKGRLKPAAPTAAPTRSSTAGRSEGESARAPRSTRARQRTRGGRSEGQSAAPVEATAGEPAASAQATVEGATTATREVGTGTHDGGGSEHHDGNAAPRRRRRRRGPRPAGSTGGTTPQA